MYEVGEAVLTIYNGERVLGEVVGVTCIQQNTFYDVSLEDKIVKAVEEREVSLAPVEDIRGLLLALLGDAAPVPSVRSAFLRQQYVAFLSRAMDKRQSGNGKSSHDLHPCFGVGQEVVIDKGDVLLLGTVRGVAFTDDHIEYEVEAAGELVRAQECELSLLREHRREGEAWLGRRMRFVVPGHEQDDAYCGVVCAERVSEGAVSLSLMFDDGDVIEELSASDLAPCS